MQVLKMLCLYMLTLKIGHKFCSMLSILNEITLEKELQNIIKNGFWTKIVKTKQQNKNKNKNSCQSQESNQGPLAPQSDVLTLDHQDN